MIDKLSYLVAILLTSHNISATTAIINKTTYKIYLQPYIGCRKDSSFVSTIGMALEWHLMHACHYMMEIFVSL